MGIVCANTLVKRHSVLKGHEHSLPLGEAAKREPGRADTSSMSLGFILQVSGSHEQGRDVIEKLLYIRDNHGQKEELDR